MIIMLVHCLPNDINLEIIEKYVDFNTLSNLLLVNMKMYSISCLSYRDKFIRKYFSNFILRKIKYKNQYPLLKFKRKFVGSTDYIDRIKVSDVLSPVMLSVDMYKRPMIIIKLNVDNKIIVQTAFQRYSIGNSWIVGSCYGYCSAIATGMMNDDDFKNLNSILDGKEIEKKFDFNILSYKVKLSKY